MAHFLRDQQLTNLTLDEGDLRRIIEALETRKTALNAHVKPEDQTNKGGVLTYVIRFDNKGYRVDSVKELLQHFHQAKEVERIFFNIDTGESLASNKQLGSYLEIGLDTRDPNRCFLAVTSNDSDWVDASVSAIQDVIVKCRNRNGWVRTIWTPLTVQVFGAALGFFLSLWITEKIAPKLVIENAFIITFLFLLLIFSNVWAFLNEKILLLIYGLFPNLKFYRSRKDRVHWLIQAIVASITIAIAVYALNWIVFFVGHFLESLVRKTP
jgi:hypothetical protein